MFWVTPDRHPDDSVTSPSLAGYSNLSGYPPNYGLIGRDEIDIGGTIRKIAIVNNFFFKDGIYDLSVAISYSGVDSPIYLGRHDKREAFHFSGSNLHASGIHMVYHFSGTGWMFNEEDIGKPIPVWISTEPPPY